MGEQEQMIAIGKTMTKYRDLKARMADLESQARGFASDLERVAQALKAPLRADPNLSIPDLAKIREVLTDLQETAQQLAVHRANLVNFGVEPKD